MLKGWVAGKLGERLIQLLHYLLGINTKLLEHLLYNPIRLLQQHPEQVFNLSLDVLAPANFVIGRLSCSLRRGGESVDVKGPFWFNAARTNVTSVDGLKESFKR